ncbi:MAG: TetR/AcrR family transcriptional regulator [Acetobacteraceae bacterium]
MANALRPHHGGRPSREESSRTEGRILDVAKGLFFRQGFAATSMEQVAATARISKRTLYARFHDKAALFRGVVDRQVSGWRGHFEAEASAPGSLPAALLQAANGILSVALEPEALALHRIVVAEAERFPELARTLAAASTAGVEWLAALLARFPAGARLPPEERMFAAEQFLLMVVSGPRRRALGLGHPLDAAGLASWATRSVAFFLTGLQADRA